MLTYVGAYDDKQMAAAIRRELLRDGQVFVIHNRVQSIDKAAAKIRDLVPEARVAVGHGQMDEHELERIMVGFWEKEYDVLVATTIVESGLDIPNANTLIVDRADTVRPVPAAPDPRPGRPWPRARLRLLPYDPPRAADRDRRIDRLDHHRAAHRPRRRHVRGDEGPRDPRRRATCSAASSPATSTASASTSTSGWSARRSATTAPGDGGVPGGGAGRGQGRPAGRRAPAARLHPGERLRLETYRKLASVQHDEQAQAVLDELTDRYGDPPAPVLNLLAVARFRAAMRALGVTEISMQGRNIRVSPVELRESQVMKLSRLAEGATYKDAVAHRVDQGAGGAGPADAAAGRRAAGEAARPAVRRPRAAGRRRLPEGTGARRAVSDAASPWSAKEPVLPPRLRRASRTRGRRALHVLALSIPIRSSSRSPW